MWGLVVGLGGLRLYGAVGRRQERHREHGGLQQCGIDVGGINSAPDGRHSGVPEAELHQHVHGFISDSRSTPQCTTQNAQCTTHNKMSQIKWSNGPNLKGTIPTINNQHPSQTVITLSQSNNQINRTKVSTLYNGPLGYCRRHISRLPE